MMPRIRKAWSAVTEGFDAPYNRGIYYGQNASKVRGEIFYNLLDCGYEDANKIAFTQTRVLRSREDDIILPDEHWLVQFLSKEQIEIVTHTYGGTGKHAGYRNHYYTFTGDMPLLRLVYEFGIFEGPCNLNEKKDYGYFYLNNLGKEVAQSLVSTYSKD